MNDQRDKQARMGLDAVLTRKPVVVLVGPTAIGKTEIAVVLAKAMDTEVLTADSRQVYRGMDIGTDKPSLAVRSGVPHRLIDLVDPDQAFNAGAYRRQALQEIDRMHHDGRIPLVVGGTGLYIRALIRGLWPAPPTDWILRRQLEGEARAQGIEYLHQKLARVDPQLANRLHPHDQSKIIRALEVFQVLGRPLSEVHQRHAFSDQPFSCLIVGLTRDRQALYQRIDERVEAQLAKGLVQETQRLLDKGYGRDLGSMKGLGYKQIAGYLQGEYDYAEAVRRLKRDTRHYAKRQLTWFRKEPSVSWLAIDQQESPAQVAERIISLVHHFVSQREPSVGLARTLPTRTITQAKAS